MTCVGVQLLQEISHLSHTALLFTSAAVRQERTGIKGIVGEKNCKSITVISCTCQKENTLLKTLEVFWYVRGNGT